MTRPAARHTALLVTVLAFAACALAAPPKVLTTPEGTWELVMSEDFSKPESLKNWKLDGSAKLHLSLDGKLLVETRKAEIDGKVAKASVLWYHKPFKGDLRILFDGKADPKSRCILFFNAQPREGKTSIFQWKRPIATYDSYAGDPRMVLYTLGTLRSDQKEVNLRILGAQPSLGTYTERRTCFERFRQSGRKDKKLATEFRRLNQLFQKESIFASAPSLYFGKPDEFFKFDVRVIGARIIVYVNGKKHIDAVDKARVKKPLDGGYFGFRDFRPTKAWYDNVRVYRRK